ncbi:MAG: Fe2+-dependent dioxygenase [Porticoccaceae bacterium]|jgi:PKHD-type hydroxylase|nr:Fe2+-dependent dioxygenase [Porticoccaceae bacterium]MEA3301145.1 Fe2+-dependent dioxygenase [Pseudomonadota bacterium]HLS98485.1 Fe2+-dependent dioxygenase [Porticoccaceae bacterium]
MLIPIDNLLDKATARDWEARLAAAHWQDGRLTAGSQAIHVKANQQIADGSDLATALGNGILRALGAHPLFLSAALPKKIFPPKFNRHREGGHYGPHVDNAILHLPGGEVLRTDLSATLFLSEPDDYEGGELVIETRYGAQQVKLGAGDLILYPATSLHEVRPVTAGSRICGFFWIESLVRDGQRREMLFDLDQSIQALTLERGGADGEVRRLAGVYHNLVRHWADS